MVNNNIIFSAPKQMRNDHVHGQQQQQQQGGARQQSNDGFRLEAVIQNTAFMSAKQSHFNW